MYKTVKMHEQSSVFGHQLSESTRSWEESILIFLDKDPLLIKLISFPTFQVDIVLESFLLVYCDRFETFFIQTETKLDPYPGKIRTIIGRHLLPAESLVTSPKNLCIFKGEDFKFNSKYKRDLCLQTEVITPPVKGTW